METNMLIGGAINGAIIAGLAYLVPRYTRHILAALLIVAAVIYVWFSIDARAGFVWLGAELLGVAVYGAMAVRGVRGSPWWLVAGWTLHPIWDIALHYLGPGHGFAPESYTVPCLTWDLITAAIIAVSILRGSRRFVSRPARVSEALFQN